MAFADNQPVDLLKQKSKPKKSVLPDFPGIRLYELTVNGTPVSKGSAKAFKHAHTGKVIVMQDNRGKQKVWIDAIQAAVKADFCGHPTGLPIQLGMRFYFERPKSHYRKDGSLYDFEPVSHIQKPDLDKLDRCVMDALTGLIYFDDCQVVFKESSKRWAAPNERAGVVITAIALGGA